MERLPFWLHDTLRVWTQYLAIVLAAIPAAALALFLLSRGIPEPLTLLLTVLCALTLALIIQSFISRNSRTKLPTAELHKRYIVTISFPDPKRFTVAGFSMQEANDELEAMLNEPFLPNSPPIILEESISVAGGRPVVLNR